MNKTKMNYWVDLIIALAFLLSAISGLVFLLPINGSSVLGVSYLIWDQVHTWGSLLMIAGVLAHLALHWKWIVAMTKKTFLPQAKPARSATATAAGAASLSRRQFLRTAGLGTLALGATAVGYKTIFGSQAAGVVEASENVLQPAATSTSVPLIVSEPNSPTAIPTDALPTPEITASPTTAETFVIQPQSTSIPLTVVPTQASIPSTATSAPVTTQKTAVTCPKGLTYDPYPGRCRHYVDRDGDGYCDYSIPVAS